MKSDAEYMALAIEEAVRAKEEGELPFGNVIVQNGAVIARGHVQERALKTVLAHSELQAIDRACKLLGKTNLSNCTIYCSNEPCLMCSAAIFQAKIPRVVIGASRSDLPHILRPRKFRIDDLAQDSGYKVEIVRGVLKEQIIALFADIQKS